LRPLDSDFPPVEPARTPKRRQTDIIDDAPLNLGADMELPNANDEILNFDSDILRRPGTDLEPPKAEKDADKGHWKWRDMLGGLQRPDDTAEPTETAQATNLGSHMVAELCTLKLAPSAVVDEGTIAAAAKAQAELGAVALVTTVAERLSEPVLHLQKQIDTDASLRREAIAFVEDYDQSLTGLSQTALRAHLGTASGRAYLLCCAALRSR